MSNERHFEDAVAKTAAEAAAWHTKVKALEGQVVDWTHAVTTATKLREEHGLAAALGESTALAAVKKARAEQHEAEQHLADLAAIALPAARVHLANAEKAAAKARHELGRFEAANLMRERVKVAAKIDALIADFSAAFSQFETLGAQIVNMPGLLTSDALGSTSISQTEQIQGNRRMRLALPKVFLRFFPGALHEERPQMTLEASELQTWGQTFNFAPVETTTTKAA